ncbi:MAG: alkaline phosphatase family protein [Acidobacteria bacterium]|nr:alkaline phosphatase family protein [Acidobacteriota bacterium]
MVKRILLSGIVAALAAVWACGQPAPAPDTGRKKLVIIGFDGMDPDLVREFMAAGQLPNLAKVMNAGGLYDLDTTVSPESPTAWASFATGVNPGKHNIYDFLVRDTTTYMPDLGMVTRTPPTFLWNWIPTSRPKITSLRGGTSFWVTAGQAGVRSSILTVPVTFPPEDVPNGELLAGLPLPDIRGTMGTFHYYATDLSRFEEGNTEFGGILKRLAFDGATARTVLVGPPNPIVRARLTALRAKGAPSDTDRTTLAELETQEDVTLPVTMTWSKGRGAADIDVDGQKITLKAGEWSKWINLEFRINLFITVEGMAQIHLMKADDDLQVYVSPVNWKPDAPPVPMSSPSRFAGDLYASLGPFRTLGWAEATWPLNEDRMSEATFMDDLYRAFDDRARVILNRLTSGSWDLLIGVIESTDRVQHMMWRHRDTTHPLHDAAGAAAYGDSILRTYRRSDQFIGEVLDQIGSDTTLMIVSDHGFHSWRKAVNMNTWLVQQGFMVLKGQEKVDEKTLDDLFGGGQFWENVDWSRTRAYAMGLGQIYFNLRGREGQGIVSTGEEYRALATDLSARLMAGLRDPDTGEPIVTNVYKRDDVYAGEYLHNASDLQVGFADGYRVSWQTTLGGSPQGIVYPNMKKWSGDHGGFDFASTAGVLITNQPITTDANGRANIIDIAPTVLKHFGVTVPGAIDGRGLWK